MQDIREGSVGSAALDFHITVKRMDMDLFLVALLFA